MKRVLYNSYADQALYRLIEEAANGRCEVLTLAGDDDQERKAMLARADAVIVASAPLTRALIEAAPRLAFVHHQGVGYHDTVDVAALAEHGIPLAITPAGTTEAVAEFTIMLMLAVLRRLPFADAELRQGRFHINALRPVSRQLAGRTVGLVGMGRIGRAVAERLAPFRVHIIYHDPVALPPEEEGQLQAVRLPFEALLERSEILSLHLPLTQATRRMIDAAALARMRPGSFLINTSRGGIVDEPALIQALMHGPLAGAALDVFDPEPPALDNALLKLPNVVLTPHVSAGTRDTFLQKMRAIFDNLERHWRGEPVENVVELEPVRAPASTSAEGVRQPSRQRV